MTFKIPQGLVLQHPGTPDRIRVWNRVEPCCTWNSGNPGWLSTVPVDIPVGSLRSVVTFGRTVCGWNMHLRHNRRSRRRSGSLGALSGMKLLVLQWFWFMPMTFLWWSAAFVAFRFFFDIFKLWPASWIDNNMKNGLGVMADDLVAAIFAIAVIVSAQHFFN